MSIGGSISKLALSVAKEGKRYRASIGNKEYDLNHSELHDDEIYAARDRDLVVIDRLPGTHYKLNFVWTEEDKVLWRKVLVDSKK